MLPTPNLDHIDAKIYDSLYEPAEDSYILLDALEQDAEYLKTRFSAPICLEIGCGTGIITAFLRASSIRGPAYYLCTDVNSIACSTTRQTVARNKPSPHHISPLDCIQTDLTCGIRLAGLIDILVFNPPYVPTASTEYDRETLRNTWAGGCDGMETTSRLWPHLRTLLSTDGVFYLVCVAGNSPDRIAAALGQLGFTCNTVLSRLAGREKLSVLRFTISTTSISKFP